ncbi:MAG: trypsin-like peptidase domain-containing protein [Planctomycetota bacterium]|jgi:S1-C subfamily serine protease
MRKLENYGPGLIVLATAIAVLLAGPSVVWRLTYAHSRARIIQAGESLEANPILEQLNQAYRDIATLVEPSVVHISTERTVPSQWGQERLVSSSGSGWVYDDDGHIVTNYHVVEEAERIEVQLNTGRMKEAEVIGFDQFTDIAVIRIPGDGLLPAQRAAPGEDIDSRPVRQGDLVFAFGSPFDFRFSMSKGVVSGIGRSVGVIRDDRGRWMGYENFIQVDAAINPGNSGGPLTDARGRVIGMNTAIATGHGNQLDEGQFAGIGLAIPIEMIEPAVRQIIATGAVQKGFLGVSVVDGDRSIAYELSILAFHERGLAVARLEPDGAAFDAGLRIGDVITHVFGRPVTTLSAVDAVTAGVRDDDEVELSVWRYEPVTDTSRRMRITLPGTVANGLRGISLLQLDDAIADWLAMLGFTDRGVHIARLELDKPARGAGLRHHDVITHVNDEPVTSVAQLRSMISSMMPGEVAGLRVWRFEPQLGQARSLTLEVELDRLDPVRATGMIPRQEWIEGLERLGIAAMATSTPRLADRYGVRAHAGVLVEAVVEGSELDGVLEPGAIIVAVMDHAIADLEEFFEELDDLDLRDPRGVRITFIGPDGEQDQTIIRVQ